MFGPPTSGVMKGIINNLAILPLSSIILQSISDWEQFKYHKKQEIKREKVTHKIKRKNVLKQSKTKKHQMTIEKQSRTNPDTIFKDFSLIKQTTKPKLNNEWIVKTI